MTRPRYGVVFPTTEIGNDPDDIRRFAVQVETLGYDHLIAFDHVVGADPGVHGPLQGPYTYEHPFHEPFVLFGYLAGLCRLELATGILVLPQRQTVLVAKQAAEVDVLTRGRLRLGVGIGWNKVEYEALGMEFGSRSRRLGEQIELMRTVWREQTFTFRGADHVVTAGGVAPQPITGTVPIWIGCGRADTALERVGRLADGWMPLPMRNESWIASWDKVRAAAERAARDPASIGLQGLIRNCDADIGQIEREVDLWKARGATHIAFDSMWTGKASADAHLEVFERIAALLQP